MRLEQAVEGCRGSAASEDGNRGRNGGRVLAGVLPLRDHAAGRTQSPGIPLRWQSAILMWERCLHTSAALCSRVKLGHDLGWWLIGRIRGVGVRSPWSPGDPERALCTLCTHLDRSLARGNDDNSDHLDIPERRLLPPHVIAGTKIDYACPNHPWSARTRHSAPAYRSAPCQGRVCGASRYVTGRKRRAASKCRIRL
jgi:hypothetical protein